MQWMARIDRMPRMTRIVLALFFTLVLVVLAWLVFSVLFGIEVFDPNPDATAPLVVVVVLGLVVYGVGWWSMVGFEIDQPWQAGLPAVVFVTAGLLGLLLIVVLVLFGLAFGYIL
jgi:hypothetical protein